MHRKVAQKVVGGRRWYLYDWLHSVLKPASGINNNSLSGYITLQSRLFPVQKTNKKDFKRIKKGTNHGGRGQRMIKNSSNENHEFSHAWRTTLCPYFFNHLLKLSRSLSSSLGDYPGTGIDTPTCEKNFSIPFYSKNSIIEIQTCRQVLKFVCDILSLPRLQRFKKTHSI